MHGHVLILIKLDSDTEQDRHKHLHWVCIPVALQVTVFPSLRELWHEDAAPEDASSGQPVEQVEPHNINFHYSLIHLHLDPFPPASAAGHYYNNP